eukprot:scaffold295923_cov32-Tisochrysis_lutea.AAC.1
MPVMYSERGMVRTRSRTVDQEIEDTEAPLRDERGSKGRRRIRLRIDVDEPAGIDLAEFLRDNASALHNRRAFYVVQSSLDVSKRIWKFGFMQDPARLTEYIHVYGEGEVKLHILMSSTKDPYVRREDSFAYRLELRVKRKLAALIEQTARGAERVRCPLHRIRDAVFLGDADVISAAQTFRRVSDVVTR